MAQTNVNIRIDEDLKREFDSLCQDLGLTMTAAFTIFAKTAVRRQGIPFEITRDIPNAETIAAIEEGEAMEKDPSLGISVYGRWCKMKELLSWMYIVKSTTKFQRDLKRAEKRGYKIDLLTAVIKKLAAGEQLGMLKL